MKVENMMPKARLMAMGIKNWAWTLVSNSMGTRPKKVVTEVRTMGRKRRQPEASTAVMISLPAARSRLIWSTRSRESFTTTPERATIPNILSILKLKPMSQWPSTAPTMPKGMAVMITGAGCSF